MSYYAVVKLREGLHCKIHTPFRQNNLLGIKEFPIRL